MGIPVWVDGGGFCARVGIGTLDRRIPFTFLDQGHEIERTLDGCVDGSLFLAPRRLQNVIHDLIAIARMADADAQSPVVLRPEMRGDVLEAVVPPHAAAEFEAQLARRNIQFVVHDQDFGRRNAMKTGERADGLAGTVHEGLRQQHPDVSAAASCDAMKA